MSKPGDTVWYKHVEATETVKLRPAVILHIIGDSVLLVIGLTGEPRGPCVRVSAPTAQLRNDTYFACDTVIAAPSDRVKGRLGRMPFKIFNAIQAACAEPLKRQLRRANEEAEQQRRRLVRALQRHAELNRCTPDEIADQARIARAHLRAVMSGEEWWTRDEVDRLAGVLEISPIALLDEGDD